MSKTIAIVSGKGGTGKTTVAVNLAAAMHRIGENVLLVDANLHNPSVGYHFSDGVYSHTIHDVLRGRTDPFSAIRFHPNGLKFVPGDPKGLHEALDLRQLAAYAAAADTIIYDAPPGDASAVLEHADQVLVVTQAQVPALIDAYRLKQQSAKAGKIVAGVVLNRHDAHSLSLEQAEQFLGCALASVIPAEEKISQSLFAGEAFVNLHPNTPAAKEFEELASRLCGRPR